MKSSAGTIPQGLSLYVFVFDDPEINARSAEPLGLLRCSCFLENDQRAREQAHLRLARYAIHVLSGREVWP